MTERLISIIIGLFMVLCFQGIQNTELREELETKERESIEITQRQHELESRMDQLKTLMLERERDLRQASWNVRLQETD